jgi:hypothetical protein
MNLREIQARFHALITAAEGVDETLLGDDVFVGDARLSAKARMEIYAGMYFYRLLDVIADVYPGLKRALGEDGFHNLVTGYLLDHPPRGPSIRDAGDRVSEYMAAKEIGAPWVRELARLEWARYDVFDAPDAEPLTHEELRARPHEALPALELKLVPAHALLDVDYAVEEERDSQARGTLLVWRLGTEVRERRLDTVEVDALRALERGCTFGLVCEQLANRGTGSPEAVFAHLNQWVSDGILCS